MTVAPADEVVAIVDEHNQIVGACPRREMRATCLPHRAVYILVFNSLGELFLQKRTPTKDVYPGHYDVAAGGVVLAGEAYEEAAARELAEELGISGMALTPHFDFYHEDEDNRVWGRAYSCEWDGSVRLQEEEVESGTFLPVRDVLHLARTNPFTPDSLLVLRRYLSERGEIG